MRKNKIYNLVKIILVLKFIIITGVFGNETSLIEEISAGLKSQDSLIKSLKMTCKITIVNNKGNIIKEKRIWVIKGEKIYMKKLNENGEVSYIVSFNGELLKILGENKKGGIKTPTQNEIKKAFFNITSPLVFFKTVGLEWGDIPISSFILKKYKNNEINSLKKLGDIYLIEIFTRKKDTDIKYQFYVSSFYTFRPVKIIITTENKYGKTEVFVSNNYQKYNEIAIPLERKIESKVDFPNFHSGSYSGSSIYSIKFEDIEVNKEIPDSFFDIKFPPGTQVYDERTGKTYEIK